MRFEPTPLAGACVIDLAPHGDARGTFARCFCKREFAAHGLNGDIAQANMSYSARAGTLRGLHWQHPPAAEAKLVRCISGAIWDVIVDLRTGSPTYLKSHGVALNAQNRRALYVPEGFAHGFLTLSDATEILYMVTAFHAPEAEDGLRYDDPALGIDWPGEITTISEKDAAWPLIGDRDVPPGVP